VVIWPLIRRVGFSHDRRLEVLVLLVFFFLVVIVIVRVSRRHRVGRNGAEPLIALVAE